MANRTYEAMQFVPAGAGSNPYSANIAYRNSIHDDGDGIATDPNPDAGVNNESYNPSENLDF